MANKNRMKMKSNGKLYWAQGILKKTGSGSALNYQVKWYGYDKPTWEPAANIPEVLIRMFNSGSAALSNVVGDVSTNDGLPLSPIDVNLPIRLWVSYTFSHTCVRVLFCYFCVIQTWKDSSCHLDTFLATECVVLMRGIYQQLKVSPPILSSQRCANYGNKS